MSLNGIGNTLEGAVEGTFNGTFTKEELDRLLAGGSIQKLSIHNPTNGIIADLVESVIGKIGVMTNSNINAKDLTDIVRKQPSLLNGMMAHSQGTIKLTQVLKTLNKTEEGRKLIRENVGQLVFAGSAVTKRNLKYIESIVGKEHMKVLFNENDVLKYITGNDVTTVDESGHPIKNYHFDMEKNDNGFYVRQKKLIYENRKNLKKNINISGDIKIFNEDRK